MDKREVTRFVWPTVYNGVYWSDLHGDGLATSKLGHLRMRTTHITDLSVKQPALILVYLLTVSN